MPSSVLGKLTSETAVDAQQVGRPETFISLIIHRCQLTLLTYVKHLALLPGRDTKGQSLLQAAGGPCLTVNLRRLLWR